MLSAGRSSMAFPWLPEERWEVTATSSSTAYITQPVSSGSATAKVAYASAMTKPMQTVYDASKLKLTGGLWPLNWPERPASSRDSPDLPMSSKRILILGGGRYNVPS